MMRPGAGGAFSGSYDGALSSMAGPGDPRRFGSSGDFGAVGGAGRYGDPLLDPAVEPRRYYSSDSVPLHAASAAAADPYQRAPVPPPRGATISDPYYDGGGAGMPMAGGGGGGGPRTRRGMYRDGEFVGESDMESVVSITSAFSSHSAPHSRRSRAAAAGMQQPPPPHG